MNNLIYLNDDIGSTIDRILSDTELNNCGLNRENVLKTLKSFGGDEIATSVFYKKYALRDGDNKIIEFTLEEAKDRWAECIVSAENEFPNGKKKVGYFRELYEYFLPAGRQMFALGNKYINKATYTNCYVTKIEDDSLEGIFNAAKKLAHTYSYGGGIGLCIGELRPEDSKVSNSAKFSTGAVSFMDLYSLTTGLVGQHGRRGALMITIPVNHPDIEKFVEMKHNNIDKVKYANISIKLTDDFMMAVENDDDFTLSFETYHETIKRTIKARDLWKKIILSARDSAEPGLLFWTKMVEMSPSDSYERLKVHSTNPCVVGDTLVYVADGRNNVSIKQLAEEGKDVPVFCFDNDEKISIRNMRNPRITGYNQPVYKITFDDGNHLKVTNNHKFRLKNGSYRRTDELKKGDSLRIITRFENDSKFISNVSNEELKQHAVLLTKELGCMFSNEDWIKYARNNKITEQFPKWRNDHLGGILGLSKWAFNKCGLNNIDLDPINKKYYLELLEQGYNCIIRDKKIFIIKNCEICGKEYEIHHSRRESGICSRKCRSVYMGNINSGYKSKEYTDKENQLKAYTDLKFKLSREPRKKEWEQYCNENNVIQTLKFNFKQLKESALDYNHRVVSVEFCGYENVYNGTVDEFHNFFTGAFESTTPFGKRKWFYFNNLNCGEQILENGGTCVLSSLLLHKFVKNPFTDQAEFDFELFGEMISRGVRHLDNVVQLNIGKHALAEQEEASVSGRRIGLGLTGLADMFVSLKIKYDSDEAIQFADKLMEFKKLHEYDASIELAKLRGPFPLYDPNIHFSRGFCATLPEELKQKAKENGLRNVAISTIAPNGSLSIIAQCSGGAEPIFAFSYTRNVMLGKEEKKEFSVYHQGISRFFNIVGKQDLPEYWVTAHDIDYQHRVKLQGVLQKHIDASISSTINLPADVSPEVVSQIYMDAWREGLKGITVYREGSREGVLVTEKFAKKKTPNMDTITRCVRAEGGDKFYIMISYKDKNIKHPYQVFVLNYKKKESDSFIKTSNALIKMLSNQGVAEDRIQKYIDRSNNSLTRLTRFLSLSMKTNNLDKAVDILDSNSYAGSLSARLCNILSESLDMRKVLCEKCGSSNIRMEEGCMSCLDCGESRCG